MRVKKLFCLVMSCIIVAGCLSMNAGAVSETEDVQGNQIIARASGKFSAEIEANTLVVASSSFPLEVGETVTINAVYSPRSASVDFGLIAPDGLFYGLNTTTGSFDKAIEVNQRGYYTLAVRNNSAETISVSGYVNY